MARLHWVHHEGKAVCWAHFATICCMKRDQPVLSVMKSLCYSGLWAEGAVIENILANKQRFIGTIEAGSEHRIMQWNLTGLRGATLAEELMNVWGPAGVTCFCRRSWLTNWSSCTNRTSLPRVTCEDIKTKMNVPNMNTDRRIWRRQHLHFSSRCKLPDFPWFSVWWYWPALRTPSSTTAW